jgi:hypothetical protein
VRSGPSVTTASVWHKRCFITKRLDYTELTPVQVQKFAPPRKDAMSRLGKKSCIKGAGLILWGHDIGQACRSRLCMLPCTVFVLMTQLNWETRMD